jgi:large subunit ribosomal protein L4
MAGALNTLVGEASALLLIPSYETYEGVVISTNNIPDAKVLNANYLNIRDLMVFDKIVLPVAALDLIKANLG